MSSPKQSLSSQLTPHILTLHRTAPDEVLSTTSDLSRLLYSQLHSNWIWDHLRAKAISLSLSILINEAGSTEDPILDRLRKYITLSLAKAKHVCEAKIQLKVLIALITRNAIRFTSNDFKGIYQALENLAEEAGEELSELLFYTLLILVSLFDDYSCMLSAQSIINSLSHHTSARSLIYILKSQEGRWTEILNDMCTCFGFDLKVPEEFVQKSCRSLIDYARCDELMEYEMNYRCLATYIGKGGVNVTYNSLYLCIKDGTDKDFLILSQKTVDKIQLKVPETLLIMVKYEKPHLEHRVLIYILLLNNRVPDSYDRNFIFDLDVRKCQETCTSDLQETLVNLIFKQLPWFFSQSVLAIPASVASSSLSSLICKLPEISPNDLDSIKEHIYFQPLQTALSILHHYNPLYSSQEYEIFDPTRLFCCKLFEKEATVELGCILLEILLSAWQGLVTSHDVAAHIDIRNKLVLCMESTCVQHLLGFIGRSKEIDEIVCDFLHSYWIENFLLIKLVHYQGYSEKILPITVDRIGSLICTWDFIIELLQNGKHSQKRFALLLAGYLACKYPTQRLLDILKECLKYIEDNLISSHSSDTFNDVFELFTQAFSQLGPRVRDIKRKSPKQIFRYDMNITQLIR